MNNRHLHLGQAAEQYAERYLITKGLKTLCKNYRCFSGEIDLIMKDKKDIVFVEVRFRSHSLYGGAMASITKSKQKRLILAATHFLQKTNMLHKSHSRFDIITLDKHQNQLRCRWLKNAFNATS